MKAALITFGLFLLLGIAIVIWGLSDMKKMEQESSQQLLVIDSIGTIIAPDYFTIEMADTNTVELAYRDSIGRWEVYDVQRAMGFSYQQIQQKNKEIAQLQIQLLNCYR